MMGKLETVTIIHGKGTGAVRAAVRNYLKRSRYVKTFPPRPLRRGRRWSNGGGVEIRVWDGIKSLVPLGEQGGLRGDWSPLKRAAREMRVRVPRRERPRL